MKIIYFLITLLFSGSLIAQSNTIPYPPRAERLRITGYVDISYDIDKSGRVANLMITDSHPYGVFEKTVKKSARSWVFEPNNSRQIIKQRITFN